MGLVKNLTINDGQVAAAAAQISAGAGNEAKRLNLTFCNVGGNVETLILTISRNGGTARRYRRIVLDPDEQFEICGLPLNSTDSLLAVTTNAASVDYIVSIAADEAPLTFAVYDATGQVKTAPYILDQLDSVLN